ncbi:MAG: glycoside hydrolase [Planctomycetes bacterium]|nr:glycoside hydrolase [Planctomycetota bacterium]MBU4400184.1 glycoside hydrolase [Planctomycetota bacterium]MCG2682061.1 glycoside hydrolase [Planctomycetales bacterium]
MISNPPFRRAFTPAGLLAAITIIGATIAPAAQAAVSVSVGSTRYNMMTNGGYGGWEFFPRLIQLQDGRLMGGFYEGYSEGSPPKPSYPRGGQLMYTIATNSEGTSWGAPQLLYDGPHDEVGPELTQLSNGTLLCTYWNRPYSGMDPDQRGTYLIKLPPGEGATWSAPQLVAPYPYYDNTPIRVLSNGRLVKSLYYQDAPDPGATVLYDAVSVSDNGGDTWSAPVAIPLPSGTLAGEADVIQLTNGTGKLLAVERGCDAIPVGRYSISNDYGDTWSNSQPFNFADGRQRVDAPYLLRHGSMILMGYRGLNASGTLVAALRYSLDEAATWSDQIVVDSFSDYAYPSMVNLSDTSVLYAYSTGGNNYVRQITITGMPIPEPGSLALLLAAGLACLLAYAWRKRR